MFWALVSEGSCDLGFHVCDHVYVKNLARGKFAARNVRSIGMAFAKFFPSCF